MKQTSRAALETERRGLLFMRKWLRWYGFVQVFVGCVLAALALQAMAALAQVMAAMEFNVGIYTMTETEMA